MFQLQDYLKIKKDTVNAALENWFPIENEPKSLWEAMRYSMFIGGKRIRPILAVAANELLGGREEQVLPVACALEMIHTYSLIHDDLPAMDNDDLRRGFPTNHKKFGEAMAILAGDTLMTYAYEVMVAGFLKAGVAPEVIVQVISEVSSAIGADGMAGGQVLDIENENSEINLTDLQRIHRLKTGALILASVRAGAIIGGADDTTLAALSKYAEHMGILFQIVDDILDVTGTTEVLGKPVGSDEKNHKTTYITLLGIEGARRKAREEADKARSALASIKVNDGVFVELIDYFLSRNV